MNPNIECNIDYAIQPKFRNPENTKFNIVLMVPKIVPEWVTYQEGSSISFKFDEVILLYDLDFEEALLKLKQLKTLGGV